jgi:hypothetical protein
MNTACCVQCTMYNAQCTMYNAQCIIHNVKCTMYNAKCTMHNAQCTMHNAQCTMQNAQCTMHNVQCIMYSAQCTMYNAQCKCTMYNAQLQCTMHNYNVQCTMQNVQCTMHNYNVQCTMYLSYFSIRIVVHNALWTLPLCVQSVPRLSTPKQASDELRHGKRTGNHWLFNPALAFFMRSERTSKMDDMRRGSEAGTTYGQHAIAGGINDSQWCRPLYGEQTREKKYSL